MKNKFLTVCAGISMIIVAAGFLVRSFGTAHAAPLLPPGAGKYQMSISGGNELISVLIWNSETGQSKLYQAGYNQKEAKVYNCQLPANPLGN